MAEGATAAYTVSLTSAAPSNVTVNLTYSGVAADGSDFTGVATVTIPTGSSSASLNIATLADVLAEGAESFTVTIASAAGGNFESLVISSANGAQTTAITDDDTPTIAVSSPTVTEGGFAVFTVSLTNASTTAVVFTPVLASGTATVGTDTATALEYFDGSAWQPVTGSVTIAAGSTSVQVRVATTDDVAADSGETFSLSANVISANTGNASASGTATINDDSDATTVSLSATSPVAEGGNIGYTATLSSAAVTAMTVTLSNGAVITIAAGNTTGTVSVPAPSDDLYVDAGNVSATIASTSGGGFEAVAINTTAATTAITDTIDTTTATLTATPSVAEGATITYTVTLAAPVTGSNVTVTLANGQTVTIPVGASSGTATGVAPDNVTAGGGSVVNSIVSASGGNFEQLTPNTAPVTTTVTDDGDVTTVSLSATPSVVEGGTITYTATLTNAASSPVTITLSNSAVITIAAGATVGTVDVAAPGDDVYIDASTVSTTISTATGGGFETLQADPAAAVTSVTDDTDATTVALTASASVAEGSDITYTATLTNAAQSAVTVTLSGGQTITIAAGDLTGSTTIAAPTDDVYVDAGSVSRTITAASGGNFEALTVDATAAVTSVTDTIDATTLSISGDATVAEGAVAAYTVSLTSVAQTAVTVTLAYSGTAANGSDFSGVTTVTIPAGASSAAFNITTLQDLLAEGAESFTVTATGATGGGFENLLVSATNGAQTTGITDDDTPTLSVSNTSVTEGGFAVFTVSLSNASTTAVVFTPSLASGTATVGTDTATALEYFDGSAWVPVTGNVTIAAGSTSVQVRVATTDDVAADSGETFTLNASVSSGNTGNATASGTATINDDADATTVSLSATPTIAEGGQVLYTATLANAAVTAMTVTLSNGAVIAIAAGNTSGTATVLAPTDDVYVDAGSVSATIASTSSGGFEAVTISPTAAITTVTDTIDTTTLSISGPTSISEGANGTYTVSLTSPAQTTAVAVNLTYSGTAANGTDYTGVATVTIPVGESSATFNVAALDDAFAESGETVIVSVASASGGNFESLVVSGTNNSVTTTIADETTADTVLVSLAGPAAVIEGATTGNYTVTLGQAAVTAVTVNLTYTGTATDGADYTGVIAVTIPAGATSATFNLATIDDIRADSGETIIVTLGSISGGGFEAIAANTAANSVTTTISDEATPDATTVNLSATASVAEGGSILYTATLTNAAITATTVTITGGTTITIAAGQTVGTVSVLAPTDDVYVDAASVVRSITATSGGGFESLVVGTASATTTVTDTIDTTTVSITGAATVAEGATAAYTVSLTSAAQTNVTVNLTYSGVAADGSDFTGVASVTILAGSSSASLNIATLQDVLAEGAESFIVTIASAAGGNFESLVISGTNGAQTTSITDDDTPALSVSSPTVTEGGLAVFTVSLSNPSTTAVVFNPVLANGSATVGTDTAASLEYFDGSAWVAVPVGGITLAAGSTSVQVRVATTDDFAAEGNETFTLTANVTAGTTANASAVGTATITDDSDATTVSLTATPTVAEGGTITYTATLTSAAVTAITVTLAGGGSITIAAGQTVGTTTIAAPTDDVYVDAGSVSRTIASTSGGGFEAVTISPAAAVTTVTDTVDTTTATLTATPSVAEGGTITYTVTLNAPVANSAVNVLLANGQTVIIGVGASSASVTAIAPDNVFGGGATVANNIVSASGGNFEQLTPNTAPVSTSVTDDGDVTTVSLTATASVVEGGSITYTATLSNAPQSDVTATLSNGATITILAGNTSGTAVVAAPGDDVYVDASTVSTTITTATGGNFETLQINPAAANTTVTDDSDIATVNLSATASIAEGGSIVYTATLSNAAQSDVTITLGTGQTITIASGQTVGSVTIAAPTDDVYVDAGSVTRSITSATGGNFENLQVGTASATTSVTDTVNTTTVSLTGASTVAEGATAAYTVSLTSAAQTTPVTVTLSYSGVAADGTDFTGVATVTIPVGSSSAALNIATLQDALGEGAESFTVTIDSASGGNFESLVVSGTNGAQTTSITDDDTPALSVSSPTVTEGGFAVFTVSLSNASSGAVVFNPVLASGTATVGTDTATALEFFNGSAWVAVPAGGVTLAAGSTSVQVRVATTDDVAADSGETFSLTANVTSGLTANASASGTATINDDADATSVALTATPSVAEGGSIIYTATLANPAVTAMTVTLSNGATIAIAAGNTVGTATVLAPTDDVYVDAGSVSASISSTAGGGFEAVTINPAPAATTVTDTLDTTTLSIAGPANVTEGTTGTYTASLTSAAQTAVTVNLAYSGTAADGSDFTGVATVTIAAGTSSATFNIATLDDNIDEVAAESFTVSVASASGGNFENLAISGSNGSVTTAITDNDGAPTLTVSSPTVAENGGFAVFTLALSNPSSTATSFSLVLANGSATAADFGPALEVSTDGGATWTSATSATFAAGATSVLARTPITSDALDETDETFTLTATRTAGTTSNTSATGTATIIDDDATPSVSIGNVSVNEADGTMTFTVTLSAASGQNVSVNYATSNGTATAGADYTAASGTLTFAAGSTSQTITVNVAEDTVFEGNETLNVTLSAPGNATIATGAAVGTIIDNDAAPTIASVSAATAVEATSLVHTVTLSNASATTTTFSLSLTDGTATGGGVDYTSTLTNAAFSNGVTIVGGVVTVPAGVTSFSVTVPTSADTIDEANETYTLAVGSASGTGTINDDDATPTVSSVSAATQVEGVTLVHTVTLSNASSSVTTFAYTLGGGNATGGGTDYTTPPTFSNGVTLAGGVLSVPAGVTSFTVSVPSTTDTIDEGASETYNLSVGGVAAVGTITDDDAAPTISSVSAAVAVEATSLVHTVTLSNASSSATTFSLSLTDGTASGGGVDYTSALTNAAFSNGVTIAGGVVTVPAGVTSFSVTVPTSADTIDEASETYTLNVGAASGTGTITDDDNAPAVSSVSAATQIEGTTLVHTVTLSNASSSVTTFAYTLGGGSATGGGTDYTTPPTFSNGVTLSGGILSVPAGVTSFTVSVPSTLDTIDEGASETYNLSVGGIAAIGTITDDDNAPTISSVSSPTVTEGTALVYAVALSNASSSATTFAYTLGGGSAAAADFGTPTFSNGVTLAGGILTVPAGVTAFSITLPTTQDALDEIDETVPVTVGGVTGTGTITDDDATPTLSINDVTVNEAAGTATFTVTLSAASGQTVTVGYNSSNGSATAGSDYTALVPGTLTFAPGMVSQTITVNISNDTVFESSEDFNVNLTAPTNAAIADGVGVGTISDNDAAPTISSVSAASAVEATSLVHTVTLSNASSSATTFSLSLTDGTATGGGVDYTSALTNAAFSNGVTIAGGVITVPAGVTSFSVTVPSTADTIDEANETYTLAVGSASGTGTINDDDAAPTISSVSAAAQIEGTTLVHTVTLSNASSSVTTFAYTLGGGTATGGGTDYTTPPMFSNGVTLSGGILSVPAGVTSFTVSVPSTLDTIDEGASETYNLSVGGVAAVGTITDDDAAPTISSVSAASAVEATSLVHTVTLSNASATATTFSLSLTDGTATGGGADYTSALTNAAFSNGVTLSGGVVTVPAGVTSFTVTVPSAADTIDEANETYTLNVGAASGAGTINDDDAAPTISSVSSPTVTEGTNLVYAVALSNASSSATTFAYTLGGGSAAAADYGTPTFSNGVTLSGGILTVPAGVTAFSITLPTTQDAQDEIDETVPVTVGGVTGTGTINDDDATPSLSINDVTVNEAAGTATFTVTLSAASGQTVTVGYNSSNGSATAGSDYTALVPGTLTFAPGVVTQTVTVNIANDTVFEGTENFNVNLTAPTNATILDNLGVGTITDNDTAPTIASVSSPTSAEGTDLVYTVTLSNASSTATTFAYTLGGGSAATADYGSPTFSNGVTLAGGILTVPAGVTAFSITLPTTQDALDEANETVPVSIGGVTGTGTITDDDAAPTLSINDVTVNEAAGTATFTVTLSAASGQTVTVGYNTVQRHGHGRLRTTPRSCPAR